MSFHCGTRTVARSPSGGQLVKQQQHLLQQQPQLQHPQVPPRATPPRDTFTVGLSPMTVAQQQSTTTAGVEDSNGFVVHKGRGVPTLASLHQQQAQQGQQQDPLIAARLRMAKEKTNADSKAEERGKNLSGVFREWLASALSPLLWLYNLLTSSFRYLLFSLQHRMRASLRFVACARSGVGDSTVAAGRPSDRAERRPSYAGTSKLCSAFEAC